MALLERKTGRLSAEDWGFPPQHQMARRHLDSIDRDRLVIDKLDEGHSQSAVAKMLDISQATVHRIERHRETILAQQQDPTPMEIISRYWLEMITHEQMMADLQARTYTAGHIPEGGYDAWVRGTWDEVRHAYHVGMLTEEDYQRLEPLAP